MDNRTVNKVEAAWKARVEVQELKPKTAAYSREQAAFFAGAIAALDAAGDPQAACPRWVVTIFSGRRIADLPVLPEDI